MKMLLKIFGLLVMQVDLKLLAIRSLSHVITHAGYVRRGRAPTGSFVGYIHESVGPRTPVCSRLSQRQEQVVAAAGAHLTNPAILFCFIKTTWFMVALKNNAQREANLLKEAFERSVETEGFESSISCFQNTHSTY